MVEMLSGGAMATDSLLPDNPGARIEPVQGGGAMPKSNAELSGNRKPAGWHSTPIIIPVSANSVEELNSTPHTLKKYRDRWRRTLGPSIPSRHRPRQDPYIVIGSLDITTCPTYVVAPLRGDMDAAKDTLFWTNDLLKEDPKAHIVFMGPLIEGGSRADGELILKMLESLMSSYPGHVMYISNDTNTSKDSSISQLPGSLDGLVLYALPHTSKQIIFGFIPDQDEVYSSSVRTLDCLEVETVRIPADERTKRKEGERMLTIQFSKAKSSYNRTKQPRSQMVRDNRKWNAPPGWVSQISYQTKDGSMASKIVQEGGDGEEINAMIQASKSRPEARITLGGHIYKVGKPDTSFEEWKQGKFSADEQKLLEETNLKFSNEVYAIFLKGLYNSKCRTLVGAETNPDCGAFRYLLSLAYFNKLEQSKVSTPITVTGTVTPLRPGPPPGSKRPRVPPSSPSGSPGGGGGVPTPPTPISLISPPNPTGLPGGAGGTATSSGASSPTATGIASPTATSSGASSPTATGSKGSSPTATGSGASSPSSISTPIIPLKPTGPPPKPTGPPPKPAGPPPKPSGPPPKPAGPPPKPAGPPPKSTPPPKPIKGGKRTRRKRSP